MPHTGHQSHILFFSTDDVSPEEYKIFIFDANVKSSGVYRFIDLQWYIDIFTTTKNKLLIA